MVVVGGRRVRPIGVARIQRDARRTEIRQPAGRRRRGGARDRRRARPPDPTPRTRRSRPRTACARPRSHRTRPPGGQGGISPTASPPRRAPRSRAPRRRTSARTARTRPARGSPRNARPPAGARPGNSGARGPRLAPSTTGRQASARDHPDQNDAHQLHSCARTNAGDRQPSPQRRRSVG